MIDCSSGVFTLKGRLLRQEEFLATAQCSGGDWFGLTVQLTGLQ